MSLRWCFSTLGCPKATLDEAIELARHFRIGRIELRMLEGTTDLPTLFAERFGQPRALSDRLRSAGVEAAAIDTSFKLVGAARADREAMLAFVPWAEALGTRYLRVFDGGKFEAELAKPTIEAAAETVRWWQRLRAENGWSVDIMVETHDCLCTSDACLRLEAELAQPVPLLWDAHHIWFKAEEDPLETWPRLRPHVRHIHVKDSVRVQQAQHPYTYCFPGHGQFPLAALLNRLDSDGFDGCVSLEWERAWHPYLPPLDEALAALELMRGD